MVLEVRLLRHTGKYPSAPKTLPLSDKSQTKAYQLQNRDRFEGLIIEANRQITSYPKYLLISEKSQILARQYISFPKNQSRNKAEDTTCLQTHGLNDKRKLVRSPKRPRLHDKALVPSWHNVT